MAKLIKSFNEFVERFNVSRETLNRVFAYIELLREWNQRVNLVGKNTIENLFMRHVVDSAQIINYIDFRSSIIDLGTGAGFPGVVLSILGVEKVYLVESDQKKASFLKEAAKFSNNEIFIENERVENIGEINCDMVTARAFAPLVNTLKILEKSNIKAQRMIFYKGRKVNFEIEEAMKKYNFEYELYQSLVEEDSNLIELFNVKPKKRR